MCKCTAVMGASTVGAVACFAILGLGAGRGSPDLDGASLAELAVAAAGEHEALAEEARQQLRRAGQPGLDALFDAFPELAERATGHALPADERDARWREAVEAVSRQRDAAFSRLYWHTDFDQALVTAGEAGRPILSLRLLGNLDDDRSCANSRFFRTVLYADPSVAEFLRERYVLHWQSVRPVPHITIDLGDGRVIERTITGNSVHYVLDPDGAVLDALPGLWSAEPFLAVLRNAADAVEVSGLPEAGMGRSLFAADGTLRVGANQYAVAAARQAERDAQQVRQNPPAPNRGEQHLQQVNAPRFDLSKSIVEFPMYGGGGGRGFSGAPITIASDELDTLADAFPAALSEPSRELMWQKRFGAAADPSDEGQRAVMDRMIESFERSLAIDSALARFEARPRALRWIAEGRGELALDALNKRVYAELFLAPLDDPWMGLAPADAYAALENEGLTARKP